MVNLAFDHVLRRDIATQGETIVITAGTPYGTAGRTNMLKVEQIIIEPFDNEANDD
jgi:pyruvate kinase